MSSAFLAFAERAAISGGNVQGDWGASPTSEFRLCIYKDTARTVTQDFVSFLFPFGLLEVMMNVIAVTQDLQMPIILLLGCTIIAILTVSEEVQT